MDIENLRKSIEKVSTAKIKLETELKTSEEEKNRLKEKLKAFNITNSQELETKISEIDQIKKEIEEKTESALKRLQKALDI